MFKNRLSKFFFLIVLCATLGLVDALKTYASAYHDQIHNLPWSVALRWNLSAWAVWTVFIPLIARLSSRWALDQKHWRRGLLFYFPLGLFFSFLKTLFPFLISSIFVEKFNAASLLSSVRWYFLFSDFFVAFIFFCLVLAFAQATGYYRQYRDEELRSANLKSQLASAELQALKMQLHPHFLFNALNSISALQFEDVRAARRMTARLGDFLRLTLDSIGVQTISLRREMEFLECYLEIERVRFQDRLTTEINVEPETLDALVPNLILQPLLENAVRHGIARSLAPGVICVKAKLTQDGKLRLEVADSGDGSGDNGLSDNSNSANGAAQKGGLGLKNTHERLKQLYGADYKIDLTPAPEGGLSVTITIPFVSEKTAPITERTAPRVQTI